MFDALKNMFNSADEEAKLVRSVDPERMQMFMRQGLLHAGCMFRVEGSKMCKDALREYAKAYNQIPCDAETAVIEFHLLSSAFGFAYRSALKDMAANGFDNFEEPPSGNGGNNPPPNDFFKAPPSTLKF